MPLPGGEPGIVDRGGPRGNKAVGNGETGQGNGSGAQLTPESNTLVSQSISVQTVLFLDPLGKLDHDP